MGKSPRYGSYNAPFTGVLNGMRHWMGEMSSMGEAMTMASKISTVLSPPGTPTAPADSQTSSSGQPASSLIPFPKGDNVSEKLMERFVNVVEKASSPASTSAGPATIKEDEKPTYITSDNLDKYLAQAKTISKINTILHQRDPGSSQRAK